MCCEDLIINYFKIMVQIYDDQGNAIEGFDEEGNPIEIFGKEEVDEKIEETKAELEEKIEETKLTYEEKVTAKDEEIERIKADIKDGEAGDKAKNLTGLRKKLEDAEAARNAVESKFETFKTEMEDKVAGIHSAVSNKKIDDAISNLTTDKEMQDKVRIHFNRIKPIDTADPIKIEEDFNIRMKEAHILAGGGQPIGGIGNVAATTGGNIPAPPGASTHETPEGELKDLLTQKMGITDKEIRDHKKAKGL